MGPAHLIAISITDSESVHSELIEADFDMSNIPGVNFALIMNVLVKTRSRVSEFPFLKFYHFKLWVLCLLARRLAWSVSSLAQDGMVGAKLTPAHSIFVPLESVC